MWRHASTDHNFSHLTLTISWPLSHSSEPKKPRPISILVASELQNTARKKKIIRKNKFPPQGCVRTAAACCSICYIICCIITKFHCSDCVRGAHSHTHTHNITTKHPTIHFCICFNTLQVQTKAINYKINNKTAARSGTERGERSHQTE